MLERKPAPTAASRTSTTCCSRRPLQGQPLRFSAAADLVCSDDSRDSVGEDKRDGRVKVRGIR